MKIFAVSIFLIFFCTFDSYTQENKVHYDLSTSIKSFTTLTYFLVAKDTSNLKKVVTKSSYKNFNFNNLDGLQNLANDWEGKEIKIIKSSNDEEILKIETYYIPLRFVKEPGSN
ncbi:hypothetical protein, partial [Flavobacterium sp. UBA4854]|uniref:hypothetical protein n=1 Tax=Flavobacterium sp. UBA4854 TaxID=1946548 RepID=UPI00257FEAA1